MQHRAKKAVILARGLGNRMRKVDAEVRLTPAQERAAAAGLKTLMPIADGATLLDLIVEQLRKSGYDQIAMVIGPEHEAIRDHCARNSLEVQFAVQDEPRGTADAVLAARSLIEKDELFAVVNSDNLYPISGLRELREAGRPALLAFESAALIAKSNIAAERIAKFATIEIDEHGDLTKVVEKPDRVAADSLVSMNAWVFSPVIFDACRAVPQSERGEFELTTAVQFAVDQMGAKFSAIRIAAGVLDLSSRADLAGLYDRLSGFEA